MQQDTESLARDPNTPSDVLETLGTEWLTKWQSGFQRGLHVGPFIGDRQYFGEGVPQEVAANPNTPPHVLVELACHFPSAFARNPVAPLLPLDRPDLIAALPIRKKWWAVRHGDTPASFLIALRASTSDADMLGEIASHVAIAGEVPPEAFREELRTLLIRDARRLRGKNRQALLRLIQEEVAPDWLLRDATKSVRRTIASSGTPQWERARHRIFQEMAQDPEPVIAFLLWTSPYNTPLIGDPRILNSWWGTIGYILSPGTGDMPAARHEQDADRYIRAAAHARLRGEEITLA